MLCALTIFVVVIMVTVEAQLPIVGLVAKASVDVEAKEGMLCVPTVFVVVSMVTVEAQLPIVELVAKASVDVEAKEGMLCVPTVSVVVSMATVEWALLIVPLVIAKASVHLLLLLLLPQVLDQEWVANSPTRCSIPSFPIGTPSTPMLRSSLLPMLTLRLLAREAPFKCYKKLLPFSLT
jgi:hypothetical protein